MKRLALLSAVALMLAAAVFATVAMAQEPVEVVVQTGTLAASSGSGQIPIKASQGSGHVPVLVMADALPTAQIWRDYFNTGVVLAGIKHGEPIVPA
jgi:hypothetical protein